MVAKVNSTRGTKPSARNAQRALDCFTFFCADLQTGFGPFVAVYLTASGWTQTDIGTIFMIGGLIGVLGQMPAGALVDASRSKVVVAAVGVTAVGLAGLSMAFSSFFSMILFAWILHALASCLLTPSITTISLLLVGYEDSGERLGRNATFAAVGNAIGAAGMGACGHFISNRSIFFVTAALTVPSLVTLRLIGRVLRGGPLLSLQIAPQLVGWDKLRTMMHNQPLIVLAVVTSFFTLGNAAMLPLASSMLTLHSATSPTLVIAACIIVPQLIGAALSPMVGRKAQTWGRRLKWTRLAGPPEAVC